MMPVQVRLSLKFLVAWSIANHGGTWVGIFALRVVGLQMRLPVVAPLEQLAAYSAFMSGFFGSCPLTLLLDAVYTWQRGPRVEF